MGDTMHHYVIRRVCSLSRCIVKSVSSADTSLRALEAIGAGQPLGVSELARRLDVSKPAAQRALLALSDAGWIRRSETQPGRWILTAKVLDLAGHVGEEFNLRHVALSVMSELVDRTTESAHLAVLEGTDIVIIEDVESTQVLRIFWPVGKRSPAYGSATGKAILSALPRDRLAACLPETLTAFTPETITDRRELETELGRIAARGYSVQYGELRSDVASVAAPICGRPNQPLAAVSIFVPTQRFPDDHGETFGQLVREAADTISARLRR